LDYWGKNFIGKDLKVMTYSAILGQDPIKKILTRFFQTHSVPHACLFLGPPGSQKKELSLAFTKTLLCDKPSEEACGFCESCHLFEVGNHPDCFALKSAGKLRLVKREQVNDLLKFLSLKSYRGGYKVTTILDADRLNPSSANALLKSLEEPPPKTVFLLTATKESDLLPTILSRCQKIEMLPVDRQSLRLWIQKQSNLPLTEDVLIRLCKGQIGPLQGDNLEALLSNRDIVLSLVQDWLSRGKLAILEAHVEIMASLETERKKFQKELLESLKSQKEMPAKVKEKLEKEMDADISGLMKQKLDDILQAMAEFFRDILILKENGPENELTNSDQINILTRSALKVNQPEEKLEYLDRMRRRLQGTVNTKLTLESLLLNLFDE